MNEMKESVYLTNWKWL